MSQLLVRQQLCRVYVDCVFILPYKHTLEIQMMNNLKRAREHKGHTFQAKSTLIRAHIYPYLLDKRKFNISIDQNENFIDPIGQ